MIPRESMQVNYREMQREAARLARIREARAAQELPVEGEAVGKRRKRRTRLPSLGAVVRATRGFVAQPS
jgi:hypothetical protein